LPFVLARIFRPTLLHVFDITNLELGTAFSAYGVVAMLAYFFGGPLADRFQSRHLMSLALCLTAIGGIYMYYLPSYEELLWLYGFYGFTTIFLFWAAMIKATRLWAGDDFQGRGFGLLEGGRGAAAAIIGTIGLYVFSVNYSEVSGVAYAHSFQLVILVTAFSVALIAALVFYVIPEEGTESKKSSPPSPKDVLEVTLLPSVWLQAIIILCAYVAYKTTDDYSLYANEVLNYSEVQAAGVGTLALWMRPIFAILAGYFADRWSGANVSIFSFIVLAVTGFLIASGIFTSIIAISLVLLLSTLIGVYAVRGIYFALMQDAAIPVHATGTAVGVMSVIGFMPDVFMGPLMGWLLDGNPGATGHQYVFLVMAIFALVGLLASLGFRTMTK
jgi:MFS family permease